MRGAFRVAIAITLLGRAAGAQLSGLGGEFQVNSYTTYSQANPSVGAAANGDFVVAWQSLGQDGDGFAVAAQRFASGGAMAGTEIAVNSYVTGSQAFAAVGVEPDGDFVVAWESFGQDGSYAGVFAQRFASGGAALGTEFQVNAYVTYAQSSPAVAAHAGGFVVAWESGYQDGFDDGVFARRYAADGTPLGGELQVNSYTTGVQFLPAVAAEADGDFVVVWEDFGKDGSYGGIFGQRFDSGGAKLGTEFQVNSATTGTQGPAAVTVDPTGRFVVAWQGYTDGYGDGVFGRRFATNGAPAGTEFQVNSYTTYTQGLAAVAAEADGDFVIAWSGETDGYNGGVFAQRFTSAGTRAGAIFQVNTYTTFDQAFPALAAAGNGRFAVAWESYARDGYANGIFGRRITGPTDVPTATATRTVTPGGPTFTSTATPGGPTATQTATPTSGQSMATCPATPLAGCGSAVKSLLKLRRTGDPTKNRLLWKWNGGTASKLDYGAPTLSTAYALCIYDDGALIMSPGLSNDGFWSELSSGFKYKNTFGNAAGLTTALLKSGTGKAKILVKGKGAALAVAPLPLTQASSVEVQLVKDAASGTECWQSTFLPIASKNDGFQFKDKAP